MRQLVIVLVVLALAWPVAATETGELILRAVDIDTGKPVAGVTFAVENGYDEDWAVEVGKADDEGVLRLEVVRRPGYYYMIWQKPKGYKVVGRDDAYVNVTPGGKLTHDFQLRRKPEAAKFPRIVALPVDHAKRIPPPRAQEDNFNLASTVEGMPGFEDKRVTFWFYPDEQGKVSSDLLQQAERILVNGRRIAAAVRDELEYFQKAVPEDRGDIDNMQNILVQLGGLGANAKRVNYWRFWCRLPGGIRLRQHGYRVDFTGLNGWDLRVPFYLQPTPVGTPVAQDRASITLEAHGSSGDQHPLVCGVGGDFPAGDELAFRGSQSRELIHAVFPEGVTSPKTLDGRFVLRGHYQAIQNRKRYTLKQPPKDYRYFVVSSWERSATD